jgi:hypothetical protein
MIVLLLLAFMVIGGVVSYLFAISAFTRVPEGANLSIAGIYIGKDNARSFKVGVLNPSYSPGNATVTRIAVSEKGESTLYDVVETDPSLENGTSIPRGEVLNITCYTVQMQNGNVTWGRLASQFAGETIVVHVFSTDATAANKEVELPFVKLTISETDFEPKVSFARFNITVITDIRSEVNLTITQILTPGIDLNKKDILPVLPETVGAGRVVQFRCNASWLGVLATEISIVTDEGYLFLRNVTLSPSSARIESVTLNENDTDHFTVTVFNTENSTYYVNVTRIIAVLSQANGTTIENSYPAIGIAPNSTKTFTFNYTWKEYRGKSINLKAVTLQNLNTTTFTVTTPAPIIVKVLNENSVFDLKDRTHFNITLQNHQSSLEAINITEIVVEETGEVINGSKTNPTIPYGKIEPGQSTTFYCSIVNWTLRAGGNLTLAVYTKTNESLTAYTFEFEFALPFAELNITNVSHTSLSGTKYLNVTIENKDYSAKSANITEITVTLGNQTTILMQSQFRIAPNSSFVILGVFDWEGHLGENIVITVTTVEGIEASWQGTSW